MRLLILRQPLHKFMRSCINSTEFHTLKSLIFFTIALLSMAVSSAVYAASYAYITNQGSNDVSVIDVKTDKVIATIPVGKSPVGIAIAP